MAFIDVGTLIRSAIALLAATPTATPASSTAGDTAIRISIASFVVSVLSLIVSGVVGYRAQLRGPRVRLRFLTAPATWSILVLARHANSPTGNLIAIGNEMLAPDSVVQTSLSGGATAAVENPGSRDGMLWSLAFKFNKLPDKWGGGAYPTAGGPSTLTVPRLTNEPLGVTVNLRCDGVNFRTALRLLKEGDRHFKLRASYEANSGLFHRRRPHIDIDRDAILQKLQQWGTAHGIADA